MVRLPQNEKQTYRLNSRAQMWPSGLTLAMTLTLNFQGQIQNLLYLSQKWCDCHETKSKHINWTLGLKCDHRVWLWPWPWPWIFKVKYRICYISAKNGQIGSKRKANILIELPASNVSNGFELDHNLDLWILKVKCDLDLWPHRWPWPWIFMVKFRNSCISEWEGWLTLHKGGGSRSFMTTIMTIWWPRSGVWIYQVVTGVTSVVGVLSTHLVFHQIVQLVKMRFDEDKNHWHLTVILVNLHHLIMATLKLYLRATDGSGCRHNGVHLESVITNPCHKHCGLFPCNLGMQLAFRKDLLTSHCVRNKLSFS